jgi:hypothetical protein
MSPELSGVLVCKSRGDFVDSIHHLIHNSTSVRLLGTAAIKAVRTHFSPETAYGSLVEILQEL